MTQALYAHMNNKRKKNFGGFHHSIPYMCMKYFDHIPSNLLLLPFPLLLIPTPKQPLFYTHVIHVLKTKFLI
jgi:hypothetical protein